LPASITITPVNPSNIDTIKTFIDAPGNVALEDAQIHSSYGGSQKEAIDKIAHATSIMKRVGAVAVVLFAVISMLIIFNTIQMAIFNRRDEITIERLLGASTWFIRGPFVVESILYGMIAALVSVAGIDLLFHLASSGLQASSLGLLDIGYASDYFHNNFWMLLTLQLGVGILIGAISSIVATRRYLKFKSK
jgi:cell division transport system permease protein